MRASNFIEFQLIRSNHSELRRIITELNLSKVIALTFFTLSWIGGYSKDEFTFGLGPV